VPAADIYTAKADPRGVVALPAEKWQEDRIWVLSAKDHRPLTVRPVTLRASAVGGTATIDLKRGLHISGTVVTPWGAPVANADVVGYGRYGADFDGTEELFLPGPEDAGEVLRTRSDAEGKFELSGVGDFPIRIQASKAGYSWKTDSEQQPFFVDRETDHVRLVLRPRLVAGLRIVDRTTGEIVRDFEVRTPRSEGPLTGRTAACRMLPGTIRDLGFSYREGEWWLLGCSSDNALSVEDPVRVFARVRASGYEDATDVLLRLRPLDESALSSPTLVALTPTEPPGRGLLRVRVAHIIAGLRLPWANIRVEELRSGSEASSSSKPFAWTFRVDLDENGRAMRALRLPPGQYRIRVAAGTGWAMWSPPSEDPWATVSITESPSEEEVSLRFVAALLRISASLESGAPIGMFSLMVHNVDPPAPGVHRAVARMVAALSEENERWWLQYGNPYRAHLRLEPGAFDLLLRPGRYYIKVTKTGYADPDPVDVPLLEGGTVPVSFGFKPAPQGDRR